MKQILLMIAVVALVGCGTSKVTPSTTEEPIVGNDPHAPIIIEDPTAEENLREWLRKPTGDLTRADLESKTHFALFFKNMTSIPKGLELLPKLENLGLPDNRMTDLAGVEKLTQIKILRLYKCQISDLRGLEKLTQLEGLNLSGNRLVNLTGLEQLKNLKTLNLRDNPDLTKAQISKLQKELPYCKIDSNPKKYPPSFLAQRLP